jgi:hypothetical protein
MTKLGSISNNHLAVMCQCGHSANLPVVDLIARYGREKSVSELTRKFRCGECGARGQNTFRIIFIGGSGEAMLGAAVRPKA